MEDLGRIKMHEEQIKHAIITIEKGGSPLKELIEPFSPSLFPEQSPSPMLIGADFGHGKSLSSLMLVEMDSGKVIHCSEASILTIKDDMKMKVRDNDFSAIPPVTWSVKVETAKQIRKFRKFRRELGLKKPRIPRKLKKKLKTKIKLMRYEQKE